MRTAPDVQLTAEESKRLHAVALAGPRWRSRRAWIVLLAAEGLENEEIALRLKTSRNTVGTWRSKFAERRMAIFE